MANWTKDDLYKLDLKYAEEGLYHHQRPIRAAVELLGGRFSLGFRENPEVKEIMKTYEELIPEVRLIWPGAGIGLAASVDQVRKLTLPKVFGTCSLQPWQAGFASPEDWWSWCRNQQSIALKVTFAFADLLDFADGMDKIGGQNPDAEILWKMAQSNLEDTANILPLAFSVDSVTQSICMVAELALKAVLVWKGALPSSFKGQNGHDLAKLATSMTKQIPHRDDSLVAEVVGRLPPYVDSRYSPAGLSKLEVVQLALGVQFIAGSTLRRVAGVDFVAEIERNGGAETRQTFS